MRPLRPESHVAAQCGGQQTRTYTYVSLPLWWENCVILGQSGSGSSR